MRRKSKMAMHNDPMLRKKAYGEKGPHVQSGHHEGRVEVERERERESSVKRKGVTGGAKMPASKIGPDGTFSRADTGVEVSPAEGAGTSIFDPVLCELAYRWFCPEKGVVLDPFAGGSVRGIVASKLGRKYVGVELRQEQVDANVVQGDIICTEPKPEWRCGTSMDIEALCAGVEADLVFSCPPYADLEVYSDDPKDLSNMEYKKFLEFYRAIIKRTLTLLKPNRFAVFVVGEVREKKGGGFYRGFVPDTIEAFEDAGARFYNEAILVTAVGSLPIRTGRMFTAGRKLGKTHQNVLVFCKGDPKVATAACGEVQVTSALEMFGELAVDPAAAAIDGA